MGAEGGDISSMDFAIAVGTTEDVIDLMRLDVKRHCHDLIPSLPPGAERGGCFALSSVPCIERCTAKFSSLLL